MERIGVELLCRKNMAALILIENRETDSRRNTFLLYRALSSILILVTSGYLTTSGAEPETKPYKIFLISRFAPVGNYINTSHTPHGNYPSVGIGTMQEINVLFYGYGFENDYDYITEVDFGGGNLNRAMKPVPAAQAWMNAYLWSRIGSVVFMAGGIGFTAIYSLKELIESSGDPETNEPSRPFNFGPMFIGLGITGMGISFAVSRHVWIRVAVRTYNRRIDGRWERGP